MESLLELLRIVAGSWPTAVMVVGVSAAIVVRRSLRQAMEDSRAEREDRALGNRAVVVQPARED